MVTNKPAALLLPIASNTDATLTYLAAATAGAADAVSLNYNGAVASAAGDSTVTIGAGFETLNIGSSGTASTAGTITFGGATVNFTGSANLTVRNAFEAAADTFDASAFTGNLTITAGAVAITPLMVSTSLTSPSPVVLAMTISI